MNRNRCSRKKKTQDRLAMLQILGIFMVICLMLTPFVSEDIEAVNVIKCEAEGELDDEFPEVITVFTQVEVNPIAESRPLSLMDEEMTLSIDVPETEIEMNETKSEIAEVKSKPEVKNFNIEEYKETFNIDYPLGSDEMIIDGHNLIRCELPDIYYDNIDYSTFQPFMDYRNVTDPTSTAYYVVYDDNAYVDKLGFRRVETDDSLQFTVDSKDDFVVGLGTYYKPEGEAGIRYLIVTTTGMYTCTTGDEKANRDTDKHNMFSRHGYLGEYAGLIEWIVDENRIESSVSTNGTVTSSSVPELQGEILYIYMIED